MKLTDEEFDGLGVHVQGDTGTDILTDELRQKIKDAAEPDCRYCDGTGIFYGNVTICGCTK
jgi:hypothetical protein